MTGEVVAATSSASFKLIFICVAVGWLLKTSRLPKETAPVLTQVHKDHILRDPSNGIVHPLVVLSPCRDFHDNQHTLLVMSFVTISTAFSRDNA